MTPQVLENLGMQAKAGGLSKADRGGVGWSFGSCAVPLYSVEIACDTWRILHVEVNFLMNQFVTQSEETKVTFSETILIWDFECETVVMNAGFARHYKVSILVTSWFLPWIFWTKSGIIFLLSTRSYVWCFFNNYYCYILCVKTAALTAYWKALWSKAMLAGHKLFCVDPFCLGFPVSCAEKQSSKMKECSQNCSEALEPRGCSVPYPVIFQCYMLLWVKIFFPNAKSIVEEKCTDLSRRKVFPDFWKQVRKKRKCHL